MPGHRELALHKVRENYHWAQVLAGTVAQVTPKQCGGLNSQEMALTILRMFAPLINSNWFSACLLGHFVMSEGVAGCLIFLDQLVL